jgi:hypothetical protein
MKEKNQNTSANNNHLLLRAEMETELRMRAYKDDAFRLALQNDPRTTLEHEYPQWFPNGKIPEGFSIKIIDEVENSLSLVLLPKRPEALAPLSEEDLAGVQGGAMIEPIRGIQLGHSEGATSRCNSAVGCTRTVTCPTQTGCGVTQRGCGS